MRRFIFVIALLMIARVHAADSWTYARSDHFEIYTTGGTGTARDALKYFESVRAFCATFWKMASKSSTPTRLIIFSNDRQFAPYRPNESAAAFYQAGADRDYIVMKRFDALANQIVVHEYMHLIFRHADSDYPVWLNEGLAEFFSTMEPESGRMVIGKIPEGRLEYLVSGSVALLPLRRLFAVAHDSPEYNSRAHTGVFYSQSWALTHMIMVDAAYGQNRDGFLQLMARGTPTADALMQIYGKTPEIVERDFRNYLTSDFRIYRPPYKGPATDANYTIRPVETFDADLVMANLQANSLSGLEAARATFTRLEQQKPNDLPLIESRAYFELRRNNRDAALPYFARAVELGTRNVALMHDYIRLDRSKAPTLLPKALAIAPDDVDIRLDQAALLLSERKSSQAVISLRGLQRLDREQSFRMYQLLANSYLQLNQIDDARNAAVQVARFADDASQRNYAAQLRKSVDDYGAERAAYEARVRTAETAAATGAVLGGAKTSDVLLPAIVTEIASPPGPSTVFVTGRIRNVDCQANGIIVELLTGGQTVRLFIDKPQSVTVKGRPGYQIELRCEPQDVPITIGYEPGTDAARKTIGYVRVLDYSK